METDHIMRINRPFVTAAAFLGPAFLAVVFLRIWPAFSALHNSLLAPGETTYSLENYSFIFSEPVFLKSLLTTLIYSVIVNPLQIAISLGLALLLNAAIPYVGFWRAIILLPVAIPQSVSAVVWGVAFRPDGPLNAILDLFGLPPLRFLTSADTALASIIIIVSWIGVGYWMNFILAGLQDIPKSLYEAVRIDGANRLQQFWCHAPAASPAAHLCAGREYSGQFPGFRAGANPDPRGPAGLDKPDHERDLYPSLYFRRHRQCDGCDHDSCVRRSHRRAYPVSAYARSRGYQSMKTKVSMLRTVAAICCAVLFVLPLWWMTVSALRPTGDIFRYLSPLSWWTLLPKNFTLEHLYELWTGSFRVAIMNSIFVTAVTVLVGLAVCSAAAFALAVVKFPFRNAVFLVMVVSFLIPFDAIAVPLYQIMRSFNLQNTYVGLILPGIGNGLAVFLLRQFFLGIPKELREAGLVDGMGWFRIYWQIYLPLSVPALIRAALILFIFQWQAYLWPLLIAPSPEYKVASVAIAQFSTSLGVNYSLIFAAAMVISLIPMVILTIFQRYYSASIAATGSKE